MNLRRATIRVSNPGNEPILLRVEPWAREYRLQPSATHVVGLEGPDPIDVEVVTRRNEVTIFGWTGSYLDDD